MGVYRADEYSHLWMVAKRVDRAFVETGPLDVPSSYRLGWGRSLIGPSACRGGDLLLLSAQSLAASNGVSAGAREAAAAA